MAETRPIIPLLDNNDAPFYPESHAKAIACSDGLTVDDHLSSLGGLFVATASGNGYTLDKAVTFAEGVRLLVKFMTASPNSAPFITINGTSYPIKKNNGSGMKISAGMYLSLVCGTDSFILLGEGGDYGTATATEVLSGYTLGTDNGVINGSIPVITGDGDRVAATRVTAGALDENDTTVYAYMGIEPDSYYKGLSWVKHAEPDLIASCIKKGATILGVEGASTVIDTGAATAQAGDILSGKTAGVGGSIITGTMASKGAQVFTPTTTNQVISAGQYLSGDQTLVGDANFVEANIKNGVKMFGKTGTFTSDGTLAANKMLSGVVGYSKGTKYVGNIASKGATTITPGTVNQTVNSGVYLSGNITVLGSSNLKEENIKAGVNIFGKVGTLVDGSSMIKSASWLGGWPNGSGSDTLRVFNGMWGGKTKSYVIEWPASLNEVPTKWIVVENFGYLLKIDLVLNKAAVWNKTNPYTNMATLNAAATFASDSYLYEESRSVSGTGDNRTFSLHTNGDTAESSSFIWRKSGDYYGLRIDTRSPMCTGLSGNGATHCWWI